MKRILWMLCAALAVVFFACEPEILTDDPDPETPDTPTDSVQKPDTNFPKVSFYVELRTIKVPEGWDTIIGSGEGEIAKYGMIYLVDKTNFEKLQKSYKFPYESVYLEGQARMSDNTSWVQCKTPTAWHCEPLPPLDSNYKHNPTYDLIGLFRYKRVSAVSTIEGTQGVLQNIPYGEYALIGCGGLYKDGLLRTQTWRCLYPLKIDKSFSQDSIVRTMEVCWHVHVPITPLGR